MVVGNRQTKISSVNQIMLDKIKAEARAAALKAEKEVNDKRAQAAAEAALPEAPEVVEGAIEVTEAAEAPVSALDAAVEEAKGDAAAPSEAK